MTGALADGGTSFRMRPTVPCVPLSIRGQFVYLPQVPVGRLGGTVERDADRHRLWRPRPIHRIEGAPPTPGRRTRTAHGVRVGLRLVRRRRQPHREGAPELEDPAVDRLSPNGIPPQRHGGRDSSSRTRSAAALCSRPRACRASSRPMGTSISTACFPAQGAATNNISDVYSSTDLPNNGRLSPTIIGGLADVNGDGVVDSQDDSTAFFGDASIIDGRLDCDGWTSTNDGSAGDGVIDGSDDCTLLAYNGTASGATITVTDGSFGIADGTAPDDLPGSVDSERHQRDRREVRVVRHRRPRRLERRRRRLWAPTATSGSPAGRTCWNPTPRAGPLIHHLVASNGLVDLNGDDTCNHVRRIVRLLPLRAERYERRRGLVPFRVDPLQHRVPLRPRLPGPSFPARRPTICVCTTGRRRSPTTPRLCRSGTTATGWATRQRPGSKKALILGDFANRLGGNPVDRWKPAGGRAELLRFHAVVHPVRPEGAAGARDLGHADVHAERACRIARNQEERSRVHRRVSRASPPCRPP